MDEQSFDQESELSEYERKMLEIEKEKLETMKGIRDDMRHHWRMESVHRTIDELGIDKEDVVFLVKYVVNKIEDHKGSSLASEGVKEVLSQLVSEEGDHNIHLEFQG